MSGDVKCISATWQQFLEEPLTTEGMLDLAVVHQKVSSLAQVMQTTCTADPSVKTTKEITALEHHANRCVIFNLNEFQLLLRVVRYTHFYSCVVLRNTSSL